MSATRFLDNLARTLAEPMPRRRALRTIGGSLAALATVGVLPPSARAAPNVGAATTCDKNRKQCWKDIANGVREEYCCENQPAWNVDCGTKANGYVCKTKCFKTATTFPCESFPDAFGWTNGVCCDGRSSETCDRSGPRCTTCAALGLFRCKGTARGCCGKKQICVRPNTRSAECRCTGGRKRCGTECCEPGTSCCPDRTHCCPTGQDCCAGGCCAPGSTCCQDGQGCCPAGTTCCASANGTTRKCCPASAICNRRTGRCVRMGSSP